MTQPCARDKEIAQLYKVLVDGNGQPSVVQQLTTLNTNMANYMKRQEDLIKEFGLTNREFYEFKAKVISTDGERQKSKAVGRWVIGLVVGILGTLMIVISAWTLENRKENKALSDDVKVMLMNNSHLRGSSTPRPAKAWSPDSTHVDSVVNAFLNK